MKNWPLATALCAVVLASCATPPKQTVFDKTRTFSLSKDATWERLLSFFTSNNIQIKTIEKDSGVIYAERAIADKSMADCGENALAMENGRPAAMNVFVRPVGDKTEVTVNTDFKVVRTFDGNTWSDQCHSTGVLERQVLNHIGAAG